MDNYFDAIQKGGISQNIVAQIAPDSTTPIEDVLEKAKGVPVGTIKDYGGYKYQKMSDGRWVSVKKQGGESKKEEEPEVKEETSKEEKPKLSRENFKVYPGDTGKVEINFTDPETGKKYEIQVRTTSEYRRENERLWDLIAKVQYPQYSITDSELEKFANLIRNNKNKYLSGKQLN